SEMRNTKQMLISAVQKAVRDITGSEVVVVLSRPQHKEHGDYATNVALVASKQKNPLALAQEIARRLENLNLDIIKQIDVVPPGFINIWLSDEVLLSELTPVLQKKSSQKVMIEFTDPNPFKEFHIGHLYSNAVGESLARLQEALGATVARANYQG
ncbi:MAG: arginine--tRNA ligase, partial [Candidatus Levybacteria bacterium RIFCSPLOWO2_01_FULL_42_15]